MYKEFHEERKQRRGVLLDNLRIITTSLSAAEDTVDELSSRRRLKKLLKPTSIEKRFTSISKAVQIWRDLINAPSKYESLSFSDHLDLERNIHNTRGFVQRLAILGRQDEHYDSYLDAIMARNDLVQRITRIRKSVEEEGIILDDEQDKKYFTLFAQLDELKGSRQAVKDFLRAVALSEDRAVGMKDDAESLKAFAEKFKALQD